MALFLVLPLTIIVIVLSVANRTSVTLSLDPISATPTLSLTAPLFFFLFAALALGILLGGIATWIGQGKWRRTARSERANASRLGREVELQREQNNAATTALSERRRDAA